MTDKIDYRYSIFIILVFQQNRQTTPDITDNEIFINITKQLEEAKSRLAEKVSYPVIDCHYPLYPWFLNPSSYCLCRWSKVSDIQSPFPYVKYK